MSHVNRASIMNRRYQRNCRIIDSVILCFLILILELRLHVEAEQEPTDEHRLYAVLMRNYPPSARPVIDFHRPVNIFFKMKLTQVLELSEKNQMLITSMWVEQQWRDEYLTWNASEHSDIQSLRIPSAKVWLPDTYIYNSGSDRSSQGVINGPYVMVRNDGIVKFPVPMKLKSNCEVDITYFPFDSQTCYIKFGSWIYDLSAVDFTTKNIFRWPQSQWSANSTFGMNHTQMIETSDTSDGIDLTGYVDNTGWILLNITLKRRERNHTNGVIFPELDYFIQIKRRNLYYIFNVIIPCAMLSSITCMAFWLPCISGEKISLGLTCFVAFSVFMLMVAEKVPSTSESIPILSVYLTIVMSFTSLSIIMAVIVTNIYEKTKTCSGREHRVPKFMRILFIKRLAHLFRMQSNAKQLLRYLIDKDRMENEKSALPTTDKPKMSAKHSAKRNKTTPNKATITALARMAEQCLEHMNNTPCDCDCDCNVNQTINCERSREKSNSPRNTPIWVEQQKQSKRLNSDQENSSECSIRVKLPKDTKSAKMSSDKRHPQRKKHRIARDNLGLYFAYEWVLVALVLDRLFFWMFLLSTLLSYGITLYVIPCLVQSKVIDTQYFNVP